MNNFSFPSVSPIFVLFLPVSSACFQLYLYHQFQGFLCGCCTQIDWWRADGCKSEQLISTFMSWIKVSSGQVSENRAGAISTWNCRVVIATSIRVSSSGHNKVFHYLGIKWILHFFPTHFISWTFVLFSVATHFLSLKGSMFCVQQMISVSGKWETVHIFNVISILKCWFCSI